MKVMVKQESEKLGKMKYSFKILVRFLDVDSENICIFWKIVIQINFEIQSLVKQFNRKHCTNMLSREGEKGVLFKTENDK